MSSPGSYLEEFLSAACRCGARKRKGESFCGACYHRLPRQMQRSLYRRMGVGYEEAFDAAARLLRLPLQTALFGREPGQEG